MILKISTKLLTVLALIFFVSCSSGKKSSEEATEESTEVVEEVVMEVDSAAEVVEDTVAAAIDSIAVEADSAMAE